MCAWMKFILFKLLLEDGLPGCTATTDRSVLDQTFRSRPQSLEQQHTGLPRDQTTSIISETSRSLFVTATSRSRVKDERLPPSSSTFMFLIKSETTVTP